MAKLLMVAGLVALAAFAVGLAQETEQPKSVLTVETELCTGVEERMPIGMANSFHADVGQVWLWCRVQGATDTTLVKHVYYYDGEEMATVELPVKSPSWRTWSSKKILPGWTGQWEVKILDENDIVLKTIPFTVSPAIASDEGEETE
ncbi:MAG: DUF2914 domain-containing protein [Candidatus Zixiibacteriota bacterium]|nr:MAG: DUF2914 domain-containing protein [candidate division Zixibacteria bacterium]